MVHQYSLIENKTITFKNEKVKTEEKERKSSIRRCSN